MKCKACNGSLSEMDYFKLPDGSDNLLCSYCIKIASECFHVDRSVDSEEHLIKTLLYNEISDEQEL